MLRSTVSDTPGPLLIFLVFIVFLLITAPASSLYGKDRFSSKAKKLVVVVDPGHGGKDRGVVGREGAMEKAITLAVAIRLKKELEEKGGFRVVLTRLADRFVSMEERRRIANREKGDLLVSLHVNGYFTPKAKGVRSYYLPFSGGDNKKGSNEREALRVSAKRGGSQKGENEMVDSILKDLKQTERINEGGRLARVLGKELARLPGVLHMEAGQIPAPILLGVKMPACLVEMGFMTNPSEEKRLRDRTYSKRLAKALARGVMAFIQSYRSDGG